MVGKTERDNHIQSLPSQPVNEALRLCNPGKGHHAHALQGCKLKRLSACQGQQVLKVMPGVTMWFARHGSCGSKLWRATGQNNQISPISGPFRLPQQAGRQAPAVAERALGIQQQYVQVAKQAQVLKTIVQQKDIRSAFLQGQAAGRKAVAADNNCQARYGLGQQVGLVSAFF